MNIRYLTAYRIALVSLVLLLLTRMAPPISWTQSQFLFSYQSGFQRRALLGQILHWILPQGLTQQNTFLIAALITVTAVLVLFHYVAAGLAKLEISGAGMLLLFSISIGLGTFVGNTGNLDGIVAILAIVALGGIANSTGSIAIASAVLASGALFHENVLPYFAPLLFANIWLTRADVAFGRRLSLSLIPMVLTAVVVAAVIFFGTHPYEMAETLLTDMSARSLDFDIRPSTLDPALAYPVDRASALDAVWGSWFYQFRLRAFGGVGLAFLAVYCGLLLRCLPHRPVLDRVVIILAVLSPLSLLFVAFDVSRFMAIALVNVFIALAMLARIDPEFRKQCSRVFTPTVLIIILVLQSHFALRDLNTDQNFLQKIPGIFIGQVDWLRVQ